MLSPSISIISKFLTQILKLRLNWPFAWSTWFFLAYPARYLCCALLSPMSGLLRGANSWPDQFFVLPNCSMLTNMDLWSHWFQTSHSTLASGFQFFPPPLFTLLTLVIFSGIQASTSHPTPKEAWDAMTFHNSNGMKSWFGAHLVQRIFSYSIVVPD